MQEKYGFVYIWRDRKHNRYYVGCHWGTIDDGYICSSTNMNHAYKRRSDDFKRKILSYVYTNKQDLLEEEYKWLGMIKQKELGKKYYNLHNHYFGHWSSNKSQYKTMSEKLSVATKAAMQRPDVRQNYLEGLKKRNATWTEERRMKQSATLTANWERRSPKDQRKVSLDKESQEYRNLLSTTVTKAYAEMDPIRKQEIHCKIGLTQRGKGKSEEHKMQLKKCHWTKRPDADLIKERLRVKAQQQWADKKDTP